MRWVFIAAGLTTLAASATMTINAAGGLGAPTAPGILAMTVVLALGAAAIGYAMSRRYVGLAVLIGLGMISGEIGAMIQTAQRVTAGREAARAPLAAQEATRTTALEELAKAEAAKPEGVSRDRLSAAERVLADARKSVDEKAAKKGCRENCRQLLQAAVDADQRDVDTARAELVSREEQTNAALQQRIDRAKAAVAALPAPQSATPLADYSGIPEWLFDVVEALALSLAINLPASALIALGVKQPTGTVVEFGSSMRDLRAEAAGANSGQLNADRGEINTSKALLAPTERRCATAEADRFGGAMLRPEPAAILLPPELYAAYIRWCGSRGLVPLPVTEIAPALRAMFVGAGIKIEADGTAIGVAIGGDR